MAVKVIRPVAKYVDEARQEVESMQRLQHPRVVELVEARDWNKRFLIVTKAYGLDVYSVLKRRDHRPIKRDLALLYVEQLLEAVAFMHANKLMHTDIKPENLLVEDMQHIDKGVRLIDFGGTIEAREWCDRIIQTRQYRAPEVILGLPFTEKADIWSVGCLLAEMVTGDMLFPVHDNRAHLAMIERVVGKFPEHMAFGNPNFDYGAVKFPCNGQSPDTIEIVCEQEPLKRQFGDDLRIYAILRRALAIDPNKRYSAQEILDHIARRKKREQEDEKDESEK